MNRIYLFEIGELERCPKIFRDYLTDFLNRAATLFGYYEPSVPLVKKVLEITGDKRVVDLCSGASGPWSSLVSELEDTEVVLSDLYPNQSQVDAINSQSNSSLSYHPESVDALNVPEELTGLRTMFTGFHNFKDEDQERIIKDTQEKGESIAIFEFNERTLLNAIIYPFVSLFGVFFVTLFVRPFKWSRILLTYIIPVVPMMSIWDGYISNLRTYSPKQLQLFIDQLADSHYRWEVGQVKTRTPFMNMTYLIGYPDPKNKEKEEVD